MLLLSNINIILALSEHYYVLLVVNNVNNSECILLFDQIGPSFGKNTCLIWNLFKKKVSSWLKNLDLVKLVSAPLSQDLKQKRILGKNFDEELWKVQIIISKHAGLREILVKNVVLVVGWAELNYTGDGCWCWWCS